MSGHSGRCPEKRGSKGLSPLFSGHPWPFLALWRKKSPKFVAIINNRLMHVYEFLRYLYVACLNPQLLTRSSGLCPRDGPNGGVRAKPRIDLILPPEKVWQKKTMMSKIPPYTTFLAAAMERRSRGYAAVCAPIVDDDASNGVLSYRYLHWSA